MEYEKLEKTKMKSNASLKRKQDIEDELKYIQLNISNIKNKMRGLNVLHVH